MIIRRLVHIWRYVTDSDYRLKVLLKRLNSRYWKFHYQNGLRKHFKNWDTGSSTNSVH